MALDLRGLDVLWQDLIEELAPPSTKRAKSIEDAGKKKRNSDRLIGLHQANKDLKSPTNNEGDASNVGRRWL
jgi:hypothetical protein